ncbi:MAG: aldo/keto reductase [Filimonas sp.]|nr:aldo/keto reductase [Filimonas sp.]
MKYNNLGKTPIQVSSIGFGCMSLKQDDKATEQLLHAALDGGINFFDTADLYDKGQNEQIVGKAFRQKRKDVAIATKVGNQWKADGTGWDWNPRKAYILQAAEASLQRLQTDYIDLYQLHGGTIEDNIDETIEAFELLKQQGKIREYGISSIRPNVVREYVAKSHIASVMMQYSLLDRRPEETALPLLAGNNIGILARGSIAQGLLSGKPAKPYLNYSADEVTKAAVVTRHLSLAERTATQTALLYVLQQPAVTAAIVGMRTAAQLSDVLQTIAAPALTPAEIGALQHALPPNTYEQHR